MVSTNLPKKLLKMQTEKPYIKYMEPLTTMMDGNSIIMLFNQIDNLIEKYEVENKEETINNILRLKNEFGYTLHKIETYINKQMKKIEEYKEESNFYSLTGSKIISFEKVLYLLIRFNTGTKKTNQLQNLGTFPPFLPFACNNINQELINQAKKEKKFEKVSKELSKKYKFENEFKGEKYFCIVPKNEMELIQEGYKMHNCLIVRGTEFAENKMHIVFLQKKLGESYIDIIMDSNDNIIWAIKDFHEEVKNDDKDLVCNWYKNNVKNIENHFQ